MSDGTAVLGLATRGDRDRLSVWLVEVALSSELEVAIALRDPWQGTKGRDDASQLHDAHAAIANVLDSPSLGERFEGVAVKRTETPRGRPTAAYDRKIRFEGAAIIAALSRGRDYRGYRTNQLGPGSGLAERALALEGVPSDDVSVEALRAACAALSHSV